MVSGPIEPSRRGAESMEIVVPLRPLLSRIFFQLSLAFERQETPPKDDETIVIKVPKHWDPEEVE